ncbi:MAG: hypothetical protein V4494_08225 [Chlamydiota bacterium]
MAVLGPGKFYNSLSQDYQYMQPNHVLYACAYIRATQINPQKFSNGIYPNIYPSTQDTLMQEIYNNNAHKYLKSIDLRGSYLTSIPSDLKEFTSLDLIDLRGNRIEPEVIVSYFHDKELTVIIDSLIGKRASELLEETESLVGYKKCKLVFDYRVANTLYIPQIKNDALQYEEKTIPPHLKR